MKHLNPRQGITTRVHTSRGSPTSYTCETPKSPPGDYNFRTHFETRTGFPSCVKHLNPRQGITTGAGVRCGCEEVGGVKHLNPRQGITTHAHHFHSLVQRFWLCETPKSPPGDYNLRFSVTRRAARPHSGVKHLNPRQGITTSSVDRAPLLVIFGVKHLNPRQGITTDLHRIATQPRADDGVKHLNPRQGITTQFSRHLEQLESRLLV